MERDSIPEEAFQAFAKLTRHADKPNPLRPNFAATMEGQDPINLSLQFGKRHTQAQISAEQMELSQEDFHVQVLKPAALALLESA